ncbi:MAG: Crp/Fnr family transcriptional regulator [Alloprevotella sp.]|nr:Crp/Fnr family transcriptional regulator [Alloprevotella sp.]
MIKKYLDVLGRSSLFRGILPAEAEAMLSPVTKSLVQLSPGDVYAEAGIELHSAELILAGSVAAYMGSMASRIHVEDLEAGRLLCPAFIFGPNHRRPVTLIARTDVVLLVMPTPSFRAMLDGDPRLWQNFIHILNAMTSHLACRLHHFTQHSLREKVAQHLLDVSQQAGSTAFCLTESRSHLANKFGVHMLSVQRVLKDLEAQGIITVKRRNIHVLDPERLEKLAF